MKPRAHFLVSASAPAHFPAPGLPEVAFAGRSNVGKSSLINVLVASPGLARTSSTPGRTRLLNWFHVQPERGAPLAFVDLPGYGYAKVSRQMRDSWRPLIEAYLSRRDCLRAVVVIIDARRGARDEELDLLAWLRDAEIPTIPVLTKVDKLAKSRRKPAGTALQRSVGLTRAPVLFSAHSREGVAELWREILRHARR